MSSAHQIEPFTGAGTWEECDNFIRGVRASALQAGKLRDVAWMADFASPLFSRKALRWHGRLPEDVRQDWSKLENSIIDRWAPPDDDDGPNTEPIAAAAPPTNRDTKASLLRRGVLKIVVDSTGSKLYLNPPAHVCGLTPDVNQALRIQFNSSPNGTVLERIDDSSSSWLAVHWVTKILNTGTGSSDHARLTLVNLDTLKSSWNYDAPYYIVRGTVSENGEVSLGWKTEQGGRMAFSPVVHSSSLVLAKDPQGFAKLNEGWNRAKIFIDPIE